MQGVCCVIKSVSVCVCVCFLLLRVFVYYYDFVFRLMLFSIRSGIISLFFCFWILINPFHVQVLFCFLFFLKKQKFICFHIIRISVLSNRIIIENCFELNYFNLIRISQSFLFFVCFCLFRFIFYIIFFFFLLFFFLHITTAI